MNDTVFAHPQQQLELPLFFIFAIQIDIKYCLIVVLIRISQMVNDVEHFSHVNFPSVYLTQ